MRLLREVIGELGLPPGSYVPRNGSGLGHANRITADAMADPAADAVPRSARRARRSCSRCRWAASTAPPATGSSGTLAAERVRAKTGTLHGKSCLSGLVGDGQDVLAFSILVEGLRGRNLRAVRGAQVGCVNAMMRYVYDAKGLQTAADLDPVQAAPDLEGGGASAKGTRRSRRRRPRPARRAWPTTIRSTLTCASSASRSRPRRRSSPRKRRAPAVPALGTWR